jgi:hypothetical protein
MNSLSGDAVGWHLVEERQRSVKRRINDGTERLPFGPQQLLRADLVTS